MKLLRVESEGRPTWVIAEGGVAYLAQGDIYGSPTKGAAIGDVASLRVLTPVAPENKVLALLDNWSQRDGRDGPGFLVKSPSARINPGDAIIYPEIAAEVWIETELGIVIGKRCKRIGVEQARDHILGYTVSNDITAAEWTKKTSFPVLTGKGFDTFCVLGPCIETALDPTNATLRGFIDGVQFFEKNTSLMLWNAFEIVSWVSQITTLDPGDVISCGACAETLTRPMRPGDLVGVAIDGVVAPMIGGRPPAE
jgi:2-keto-4-pentenoate hydratase/2-oxohepta-3-ene-1,7-dioic acid hydratase in catechol pathway